MIKSPSLVIPSQNTTILYIHTTDHNISKRSIDETGLSTAASSPTPIPYTQKKRKSDRKWKSVPVEVPGYEMTKINSSKMAKRKMAKRKMAKRKINMVYESDSEASIIILKQKKVKSKGASDTVVKTKKKYQTREEKREEKNRKIADDYTRRLYYKMWKYKSFGLSEHYVSPPPNRDLFNPPDKPISEEEKIKREQWRVKCQEWEVKAMILKRAEAYKRLLYNKLDDYKIFDMEEEYIAPKPSPLDLDTYNETPATSASPVESILQDNTYIPGTTPTTFYAFRRLPQELRDMIWSLSILPRVVPLTATRSRTNIHPILMIPMRTITTTAPIPALLHVCHESRLLALKHYTLAFDTYTSPCKIYFDFENDTAFFRDKILIPGVTADEYPRLIYTMYHQTEKVTHLALQNQRSKRDFHILAPLFPALKTLDIVLHDFHDPHFQNTPLSYSQMPGYILTNPLFYPTSSSSSSPTYKNQSSDFATRKFLRKYQLLSKEEVVCSRNGEPAVSQEMEGFMWGVRENRGEGIESRVVIAGFTGRRRGLVDAIVEGAIEGVIEQCGIEVIDRLRSLGEVE